MTDILVIDDEKDIRELICDILEDESHGTRMSANSDDALAEINAAAPDLVILDIWLKDSKLDGIDILKILKRDNPDVPVVIISGHGNIEIAVAAIKQGAYDFIEKPFNIDQLLVVINRALEASKLRRENSKFKIQEVVSSIMIGESSPFKALKAQLDKVTGSNARIMLTGPAGSGKEVAARYIHNNSNRTEMPFVSIACATIEPDRMEEVLFGVEYEEDNHKPGLLEQAHGGVLFFDEVSDMPLGTQSKILRILVDQAFTRVNGGDIVRVDLRVISSTNKNLKTEIEQGKFREELFHRLNVVPISVPSLSMRNDDIEMLVAHFIQDLNKSQGLPVRSLSVSAREHLQSMDWPGNIRQLRNLIERILILGPETGEIEVEEMPGIETVHKSDVMTNNFVGSYVSLPLREAREQFEREYLMAQVNRFGGNISKTSNFVGMERSALHRKLKSLNVATSSKSGMRIAELVEEDAENQME